MAEQVPPLVQSDWLAARLGAKGIVVVDATYHLPNAGRDARAEYAQSHLPGAIFLDVDASRDEANPLPHMGPAPSGFAAAMAVVTALKKTNGDTGTEKLIATMEGMSFETPKGRMTFRKEDHQAMQDMFHFRIRNDPAFAWGVPELVRVIKAEELQMPIRNKR